jgi:predicted nucleic acid-binding protein
VPSFLPDASALAKLYHAEPGSEFVERTVNEPGNRCLISRLSVVEMESVLAIKVRSQQLDQLGSEIARRRLRADLAQRRLLIAPPVDDQHLHRARMLLARHGVTEGLRTLDALQLSIALDLRDLQLISVLVAADRRLCRVAELEGCAAVDPLAPGLL